METIFIINPMAGQGKNDNFIKTLKSNGLNFYITKSVGDAEDFVRNYCEENGPARFLSCGGDGTFNEVLNGLIDTPDAEIGVLPMGTGNDFCRNFEYDFSNFIAQITGNTVKCDAIRYTTNGKSRYCANMFNIGFDCNVADMATTMKKKPFISGSLAYFSAILAVMIKKKGANIKLEIDDKEFFDGQILLTSIANGKFCGGGIMSNPLAEICDGFINVNIIYNIPRRKFITLLPRYMKGTHINLKNIEKVIYNTKCKKIKITPNTKNFRICVDGEIQDANTIEFEIAPQVFNFVVPSNNK